MADYLSIRRAIEERIATIPGGVKCVFEGEPYSPSVGTPWMEAVLLPAETENPTIGAQGVAREQGIMQVTVRYPNDAGPKDVTTQAELVRSYFTRGTSMAAGSDHVIVARTPSLSRVRPEQDWLAIVVSIPFFCNRLT